MLEHVVFLRQGLPKVDPERLPAQHWPPGGVLSCPTRMHDVLLVCKRPTANYKPILTILHVGGRVMYHDL